MKTENSANVVGDSGNSGGFGGGLLVGIVVGIGFFLLTVQILYWAK